ncbi:MAG TPA: nitrate reductase molybdenum cofactor assembly chaperone, partial [Thiobacillaceae bacterium]|nr:nitrate reductase molybdenum cofactor assembly chaperone [Thiobacillaceae bacterium]
NELPDYLPLVLEFASQLDPDEARVFLSQWSKVLGQLATNLEEAGSPYAPLVRLVEQRSLLVRAAA